MALVAAGLAVGVEAGGGKGLGDFSRSWRGRRVVLRQTLYTVQYDEVGRLNITHRGKLAGLTVASPSGMYYRFEAPRSGDEDTVDRDPQRVFDLMGEAYHRNRTLDSGTVRSIVPLLMTRYEPGVELVVKDVDTRRDRIRLVFRKPDQHPSTGDFATALTVQWPVPFSPSFDERPHVEDIILRFVEAEGNR
jgi:hypothetical protein